MPLVTKLVSSDAVLKVKDRKEGPSVVCEGSAESPVLAPDCNSHQDAVSEENLH